MPNWCKGNIRLRGAGNAIFEFMKNEIKVVGYGANPLISAEDDIEIEDNVCEITVKCPEESPVQFFRSLYINNTHRNFIDGKTITFYIGDDEDERKEKRTVCIDGFKAAWGIVADPYVEKARKYGLDIKIVGFERGMEFAQIIEIVNGELIKDQEIKFDDWNWECLMPNMGG